MNTNTFDKLGYFELKEKVKEYCISGLGKILLDNHKPQTNITLVKKRLKETTEAKNIINNSNHIPFNGVSDINLLIDRISKGDILDPAELTKVSDFLRGCRIIKKFMKQQEFYAPVLSEYALALTEFEDIEVEINDAIRNNRVDSNASKELAKARRLILNAESRIEEKLEKFLSSSSHKKYIQEFYVSKRNDKYVIPIKAAYKNHIEGVVVDVSPKGSTVFMEPSSVSKLNNELNQLRYEEKAEEYQVLAYLTGMVAEAMKGIHINLELIATYDMVFAKAKYSIAVEGIEPKVNDIGHIHIINGKHPLLDECVPLNFKVGKDKRTLVITGPNAGGKTVALKTIGIMTLAMQLGLHIEADTDTELSVFDNIFVDIGDNQSIENALSTFSSHIKNIAQIINKANNASLILFDEIGTGTEPNEGARLAIAILEELYHQGSITVATTHYADIKEYAMKHPEFENAYMKFNPDTLEPLYQLVIGDSGESNALWISKKMGLKESVLKKAKAYINHKAYNFEVVKESKIKMHQDLVVEFEEKDQQVLEVGDKVMLLDDKKEAIVYKEIDKFNNIEVMVDHEFKTVNRKRIELLIKRDQLYPPGYDLNALFVSFDKRKLDKDIQRGSKKALKKIFKDMKHAELE